MKSMVLQHVFLHSNCVGTARGIKLIYLSPYSPDFNPIEEFFSAFKAYIKRNGAHFRAIAEEKNPVDVVMFLYNALDQVDANSIQHFFRKY